MARHDSSPPVRPKGFSPSPRILRKCCMSLALWSPSTMAFVTPGSPFVPALRHQAQNMYATAPLRCHMGIAGAFDDVKVAVCGPSSGLPGVIAERLMSAGGQRRVELADPAKGAMGSALLSAKVVIVASDAGPDATATDVRTGALVESVLGALPSSAKIVLFVSSPPPPQVATEEETKAAASPASASPAALFSSLLKGKDIDPLTKIRTSLPASVEAVVVHTGRLFGAQKGKEPVPFLTGPKAEPVLDESYTRQAVRLGGGSLLANAQAASSKRLTVAEAVARFLELPDRAEGTELSVVSVDGPAPTDAEWAQEFKRLDDSRGVQVFTIELAEVTRRAALVQWLVESWGPQLLRKVPAALISSGSRPVRVAATDAGAAVIWEGVDSRMNVMTTGRLLVTVSDGSEASESAEEGSGPGIRVLRVDGKGAPRAAPLVGEEEVVQQLIEGLNSVVFPKGYARRRSSAKAAAAAPARAKASVAAAPGIEGEQSESPESLRPGRSRRGPRRRE